MKIKLISPYGGKLVNLLVNNNQEKKELWQLAKTLPSIYISARSMQDLELLATGALSPLDKFMSREDYLGVIKNMKLVNGTIFPIPITLPIHNYSNLKVNKKYTLRSPNNEIIGLIKINEIYKSNKLKEILSIYKTTDPRHPLVSEILSWGDYYVSGPMKIINLPKYYDYPELRLTPLQVRKKLLTMNNKIVVAFQTRNPIHRAHEFIMKKAASDIKGNLLIHPTVGITKPDDIDYIIRTRVYKIIYEKYFNHSSAMLSILPLAMRFAGPKEAIWHAIIRRNYGASHFIVGRDHASPGKDSTGKPFYDPNEAQNLIMQFAGEIGVKPVIIKEVVYSSSKKRYVEMDAKYIPEKRVILSGSNIRKNYLSRYKKIPSWYTRPKVATILANCYVPLNKRGFCLWFTGLPCSGKSTIASMLQALIEKYGRKTSLLDGDVIRTNLSIGLGFSKTDRNTNLLRIGFVASEIVKHNGIVITATVSPYNQIREQVRNLMPPGLFILIFVNTPLIICQKRDIKGLYNRALKGLIKNFTGISDPYEQPTAPEIELDTVNNSPKANAGLIFKELIKRQLL